MPSKDPGPSAPSVATFRRFQRVGRADADMDYEINPVLQNVTFTQQSFLVRTRGGKKLVLLDVATLPSGTKLYKGDCFCRPDLHAGRPIWYGTCADALNYVTPRFNATCAENQKKPMTTEELDLWTAKLSARLPQEPGLTADDAYRKQMKENEERGAVTSQNKIREEFARRRAEAAAALTRSQKQTSPARKSGLTEIAVRAEGDAVAQEKRLAELRKAKIGDAAARTLQGDVLKSARAKVEEAGRLAYEAHVLPGTADAETLPGRRRQRRQHMSVQSWVDDNENKRARLVEASRMATAEAAAHERYSTHLVRTPWDNKMSVCQYRTTRELRLLVLTERNLRGIEDAVLSGLYVGPPSEEDLLFLRSRLYAFPSPSADGEEPDQDAIIALRTTRDFRKYRKERAVEEYGERQPPDRNSFRDVDGNVASFLCQNVLHADHPTFGPLDGYYAAKIGQFHSEIMLCNNLHGASAAVSLSAEITGHPIERSDSDKKDFCQSFYTEGRALTATSSGGSESSESSRGSESSTASSSGTQPTSPRVTRSSLWERFKKYGAHQLAAEAARREKEARGPRALTLQPKVH